METPKKQFAYATALAVSFFLVPLFAFAAATSTNTLSAPYPGAISTKFNVGTRVVITDNLNIREFQSITKSTLIGAQPRGTKGTVVDGPIYRENYWWWKMDFDQDEDGWAVENYLAKDTSSPPPTTATTTPPIIPPTPPEPAPLPTPSPTPSPLPPPAPTPPAQNPFQEIPSNILYIAGGVILIILVIILYLLKRKSGGSKDNDVIVWK